VAIAYLSLGSNLGDRAGYIRSALELLNEGHTRVLRRSRLYETEPRDFLDQPAFINAAAEVETELPPRDLLARIHEIETKLGRQRVVDKGPRTLDIDILMFDDAVVDEPDLQIPHPRMRERRFVLEPLSELVPGMQGALRAVMDQVVRPVS
jgi:2-amino-4-hydroxy-6-hydroxymethyldihydropteridine diphosphokinase